MLTNSEQSGFAVRRIDRTIARSIASTAIFIVFLQAIPHAFYQRQLIDATWFWVEVGAVALIQLAQVVVAWVGNSIVPLYFAMYVTVLSSIATWQLTLAHPLPIGEMPWLWWMLAIGGMNAFGAFRPVYAFVASCTLSAVWLALSQTDEFGPREFGVALQDTLLAFFFSTLLGMLLIALRQQTAKIDLQMSKRATLAAAEASAKALEAERSRMNAIVHDSVLTALLLGAGAETPAEREAAAAAASSALAKLTNKAQVTTESSLSVAVLFDSLESAALAIASDLEVSRELEGSLVIPGNVAEALTEATVQAATNSVRHAGTVRKRELRLSATDQRLKIVVKDDGRGFRENRISKSRLGVRLSIRGRVVDAGGRVAIQSQPGQGCTVALVWPAKHDSHVGDAP